MTGYGLNGPNNKTCSWGITIGVKKQSPLVGKNGFHPLPNMLNLLILLDLSIC